MASHDVPDALAAYFNGSGIALTLADSGGDHPLRLANERFRQLTGYAEAEIVGRNCRFLQGGVDSPEAREKIHRFLQSDRQDSVRTPLLNFRKDGVAFVNLLFMSKLRGRDDVPRFIFASQFDVSRSQPELLHQYDERLGDTLMQLSPVLKESGIILDGTLNSIANTATMIAQAKLMLADLDGGAAA